MKKGLYDLSEVYYDENLNYMIFSDAEDKPKLIEKYLKKEVAEKTVLDVGCGTGKYIQSFERIAKEIVGFDKSDKQINFAKSICSVKLICADATEIPFGDKTFDISYSTWVLGTIEDINIRNKVLNEIERVTKSKIILVENDIGGEFEEIRGRYPNISRTKEYNNYLLSNGFKMKKKIDTYFEFENIETAKKIFTSIWSAEIDQKIRSNIIQHKVVIFEKTLK